MKYFLALLLPLLLVGCNPPTTSPTPATTPSQATTPTAGETPAQTATPGSETASAEKKVFFANLEDGATVKSPVKVEMGVEGMTVHPAGEDIPNTGHHHIIIDGAPVETGRPVPADEKHIHFGKGQTETEIELTPGEHTLTLQFANYAHQSYGPEMSKTIKITVE